MRGTGRKVGFAPALNLSQHGEEGGGVGGGWRLKVDGRGAARLSGSPGEEAQDQPTRRQTSGQVCVGWRGEVHRAGMGRITPLWTLFAPPGQWVDELCP